LTSFIPLFQKASIDFNMFLFTFRKDLTAFQFKKYDPNALPDVIREVWKFLFTTAGNASSSIRLAFLGSPFLTAMASGP
jgi:hypothetical protein